MNAAEFNARYPVGTPVVAYPACRPEDHPNDPRLVTRTRSVAQVLGGHTDVVWVDGHSACIALSHIDVITEAEFKAARAEETAAAVAAQGALPVPVGDQPQPLDDTRLTEIAARVERRFDKYCERGQVSLAQLNFMTNDARAAVAVGVELLAEVERLKARIAELERPAVEAKRGEIQLSYQQLATQAREDGDSEGEATVLQQLADREAQWAREDEEAAS